LNALVGCEKRFGRKFGFVAQVASLATPFNETVSHFETEQRLAV